MIGELSEGQTGVVQDNAGTTAGSASFTCTAGNLSAAFNKTCGVAAAANCPAQQIYWTVGGNTCDATAPGMSSGQTASLSDGIPSTTGSASVTCTNGTWGAAFNRVCNAAAAPPPNCPGSNLTWYQGSDSCTAYAPTTASGGSVYLADTTAPTTGTANATCTNGSWGAATGSCQRTQTEPPPPAGCPERLFSLSTSGWGGYMSWYTPVPIRAPAVSGPVRALLVYPPERGYQVSIPSYILNSYGGSVFTTWQVFPQARWNELGIYPQGGTVVPRPYVGLSCSNGTWVLEQSGGQVFDATGG